MAAATTAATAVKGPSATIQSPQAAVKAFSCTWPNCNKSFSRAEHLNRHALNHDSFKANITCERCNAVFKRKDLLERHLSRHKEKDEKAGGEGLGKLQTRKRLWRDSTGTVVAATRPEHEKRHKTSLSGSSRTTSQRDAVDNGLHTTPSHVAPISPPGSSIDLTASAPYDTSHFEQSQVPQIRDGDWTSGNPSMVSSLEPLAFLLNGSWGSQFPNISGDDLLYNDMFMPDTASSFNNPFTTPTYYNWLFEEPELSLPDIDNSSSPTTRQTTISEPLSRLSSMSSPPDMMSPETSAANQMLALSQHGQSGIAASLGYSDNGFLDRSILRWDRPLTSAGFNSSQSHSNRSQATSAEHAPIFQNLPIISSNSMEGIANLIFRARPQAPDGSEIGPDHPLLAVHMLQEYCDLYFTRFNISYPLLHRATFNPDTVNPLLLLSVIMLGASYADKESHIFAICIHDTMRAQILASPAFSSRPTLWMLQTILLVECFGKSRAGQLQHDMSHLFHGLLINLIRRSECQSATCQILHPNVDDDTRWRAEVDVEQRRRLALLCFMWDTQHAVLFSQSLCMNAAELKLTLPWNNSLWEAGTAQEFCAIKREEKPQPCYLSTLKTYINPKHEMRRPPLNALSRILMLHGLMSVAWDLHRRDQTSLGLSVAGIERSWQHCIARAYDTWKADFDTYTTSILATLTPGAQAQSSFQKFVVANLAIYHAAHIILHLEIIDLQIFAGASHIIGRPVAKSDLERSKCRVRKLVQDGDGAAKAVVHAARILRDGMTRLKEWDAGDVLHYPWCLYLATLTVWAFQVCSENVGAAEPSVNVDEDSDWDAQAETMALVSAMTRSTTEDLDRVMGKYRSTDLPRVMARHLSTIRWAVVQEGMIVLKGLSHAR